MTSVTVSLNSAFNSFPHHIGGYGFTVGQFVRMKKQRKVKDRYFMVTRIRTSPTEERITLIKPNFYLKKNSYAVERMRKIYKHKPKKSHFALTGEELNYKP